MKVHSKNYIETNINSSIKALYEYKKGQQKNYKVGDWFQRDQKNLLLLQNTLGMINPEVIENFRGRQIYVSDYPSVKFKKLYYKNKYFYKLMKFINYFIGSRRGELKIIKMQIQLIKDDGAFDILRAHQDLKIGNPLHYKYNGINLTGRYLRHIYFYNILDKEIGRELSNEFTALDIGSSYGVFSGLIKAIKPKTRHILVDLEGQILLAEYYLASKFPDARIANAKDILENGVIDSEFVSKFDFVLVPVELYGLINGLSVDLVTNFLSLGEMSREWFSNYIESSVFKSARFLYTVNRYDSAPTYSNGLTILDYPLHKYSVVRMKNCKFFTAYIEQIYIFFYKLKPHSSGIFEFIGKKNS